ncbi:MAG: hypothetical protein K2X52_31310 [Mycobacteriaceae bacterium]|nr:hypothetical protein [Mycobacteriaceae bacterium]
MSGSPLKKPEGISWNAASVELPEIPMLPPGPDAMSATISAVLPTLAAQLTANVAVLQAKEHTYSGKVGDAQMAYSASDESGSQSVGQVVGMLGKLGEQAGQLAGAPSQAAQGGSGMFGSLIEQVMKAAQGGEGGEAGQPPVGGAPVGAAPAGGAPPPGQAPGRDPLEQRVERLEQRAEAQDRPPEQQAAQREDREPLMRADDRDLASGPRDGASGAAPVAPPEQPRHAADEDLNRRL